MSIATFTRRSAFRSDSVRRPTEGRDRSGCVSASLAFRDMASLESRMDGWMGWVDGMGRAHRSPASPAKGCVALHGAILNAAIKTIDEDQQKLARKMQACNAIACDCNARVVKRPARAPEL
eukprot:1151449-Pelagomonas_calceolata.AAC.5